MHIALLIEHYGCFSMIIFTFIKCLHLLTKFATLWIFISAGEVHSLYSISRASRNSSRPTVHPPCCPHRLTRPWQWQTSKKKFRAVVDILYGPVACLGNILQRVYLKHLIEPWATDGDWVQRRKWRLVSLANVFKLQHGVLTMDNLSECQSRLKCGKRKHTCIALTSKLWTYRQEWKAVNKCKQCVNAAWLAPSTDKTQAWHAHALNINTIKINLSL